jgi:hypothetical protein
MQPAIRPTRSSTRGLRPKSAAESRLRDAIHLVIFARVSITLLLHAWSVNAGFRGFNPVPYGGGDDGEFYVNMAREIRTYGQSQFPPPNSFPTVLVQLSRLGITDVLVLKLMLTLIGCLVVAVLARIGRELTTDVADQAIVERRIWLFAGFMPNAIFWGAASVYRDQLISLSVAVCCLLILRLGRSDHLRSRTVLFLTVWGAILFSLRAYAIWILVLGVGAYTARRVLSGNRVFRARGTVIRGLVAASVAFVGFSLLREVGRRVTGSDPFSYREAADLQGGSSLGISFSGSYPVQLVLYVYSLASNSVGPLPWQVSSIVQLIPVIFETPVLILIIVRVRRQLHAGLAQAHVFILTTAMTWLAVQALWLDNVGAAMRQRVPAWLLLTVIAAATSSADSTRRSSRLPTVPAPTTVNVHEPA